MISCAFCDSGDVATTKISVSAKIRSKYFDQSAPVQIIFTKKAYDKITIMLETIQMIENQAKAARAFKLRRFSLRSRR